MVKLALVMGGGVSLGSYISGALYELLFALATNKKTGVEIEVLTGASAGSMTAALVARALLHDPSLRANLRTAWVEEIDIRNLLEEDAPSQSIALLSERKIRELADRMLLPPDPTAASVAPYCADPLRMAFTLSNLEGTPYKIAYNNRPSDEFATVLHSDWQVFELPKAPSGSQTSTLRETWIAIKESALASGAFPFAFAPKYVSRKRGDYANAALPSDPDRLDILCTDGGTFNNEPLGIAKDLVERNPEHRKHEYRYIVIDPYLSATAYRNYVPPDSLNLVEFGKRLVSVILGESVAHDWLRVNKVNKRLEFERQFIPLVADLIARLPNSDVTTLKDALRGLSGRIARFKVAVSARAEPSSDAVARYLEANTSRIRDDPTLRTVTAARNLAGEPDRSEVLENTVFVLENVAGLRDKETMDLYLIAPQDDELAGNFMFNFGGFFRREWRDHDFRKGRKHARKLIEQSLLDCVEYDPEPAGNDDPYNPPPLGAVGTQSFTERERTVLREALDKRFDRVLSLLGLKWFQKGLVNWLLRGQVYRLLGLETPAGQGSGGMEV